MQVESWKITGVGFHFGRHGLGQEATGLTLPSDSLFAALVYRLAERQGNGAAARFIAPFLEGKPPFLLTSTFPQAGPVRFFPAPLLRQEDPQVQPAVKTKDLKKIDFLSEALFRRWLAGEPLCKLYLEAEKLHRGQALLTADELKQLLQALHGEETLRDKAKFERRLDALRSGQERLWTVELRPRVALGRSVVNSSIFHTGRVVFASGCGLWFGVRWLDPQPELKALLNVLLEELSETGLGGVRSAGFGSCKIAPAPALELPEAGAGPWINLSRYLPREDELPALLDRRAAYQLAQVGGWLDSFEKRGQRRKSVNLLVEGSILGAVDRPAPGRVVDVRPHYPTDPDPQGHPVYRSGLAFAVGIHGGIG
jgi:CRISPR-associated protein Csm4